MTTSSTPWMAAPWTSTASPRKSPRTNLATPCALRSCASANSRTFQSRSSPAPTPHTRSSRWSTPRTSRRPSTIRGWESSSSFAAYPSSKKQKARSGESGRAFLNYVIENKRRKLLRCHRFLFRFLFRSFHILLPARLLVLLLQFRADELQNRQIRSVSQSPARPDNARVAAGTVRKSRRQVAEQLFRGSWSHQECRRLASRVQRVALAERNHFLRQPPGGLRPQDGGVNAFLLDEVRHQVAQHRAAMRGLLPEFGP